MYPYDENNNTPSGGNNNEQRCDAPAEDGSYRIVKPDAEQNTCYRDAAYTPQSGASFDGYYVPGGRGGKPTEPEKKPHKRGMGAAGVIALCLVCALLAACPAALSPTPTQPAAVVSETDHPGLDTPWCRPAPAPAAPPPAPTEP